MPNYTMVGVYINTIKTDFLIVFFKLTSKQRDAVNWYILFFIIFNWIE